MSLVWFGEAKFKTSRMFHYGIGVVVLVLLVVLLVTGVKQSQLLVPD